MAFRPFARRHGRGCPVSRRLRWGRAVFCLAGANYNQIRARPRWGRLGWPASHRPARLLDGSALPSSVSALVYRGGLRSCRTAWSACTEVSGCQCPRLPRSGPTDAHPALVVTAGRLRMGEADAVRYPN